MKDVICTPANDNYAIAIIKAKVAELLRRGAKESIIGRSGITKLYNKILEVTVLHTEYF